MGAARRREAPFPENAGDVSASSASRGLVEEDTALLLGRRGRAPQFLAEIDPSLHRRTLFYRLAPTGDVGEFVERLAERFRNQHPGPARHIGNRILVEDELAPVQAAL